VINIYKCNILYISVTTKTGGGPKHIDELMGGLNKHKFRIYAVAPDDGEYFEKWKRYCEEVYNLELKPFRLTQLFRLITYVKDKKINIIHSHGKGAGIYSRLVKMFVKNVKVVHTFHGIHCDPSISLAQKIYFYIERIIKYNTDAFINVSNEEQIQALKLKFIKPEKSYMIYNGIDIEFFKKYTFRDEDKKRKLGLDKDAFVIGNISRFDSIKGHRYLIEGFSMLVKEMNNAVLVLVGDGLEKAAMQKLVSSLGIQDKVYFLGNRTDIPSLLSIFDIFVFPSIREGLPYALIEALAAGVPIVATNVIGNNELIKDGMNGVLCKPKSGEAIFEAIKKILDNKALCDQFKKNGLKYVHENFQLKKMIYRTEQVYINLL